MKTITDATLLKKLALEAGSHNHGHYAKCFRDAKQKPFSVMCVSYLTAFIRLAWPEKLSAAHFFS